MESRELGPLVEEYDSIRNILLGSKDFAIFEYTKRLFF